MSFVLACSSPTRSPAPAATSATSVPAGAPVPADAAASAAASTPEAAIPPVPARPAQRDPREIGFVSGLAAYRSGGRDVTRDLSTADEQKIADCFDRTIPLDRRQPVVYYVHVFVPNPERDSSQSGGYWPGAGATSGVMYPEAGTYPDFEACVVASIPSYSAPADVANVEIRMHVHTVAEAKGSVGRGGGGGQP